MKKYLLNMLLTGALGVIIFVLPFILDPSGRKMCANYGMAAVGCALLDFIILPIAASLAFLIVLSATRKETKTKAVLYTLCIIFLAVSIIYWLQFR